MGLRLQVLLEPLGLELPEPELPVPKVPPGLALLLQERQVLLGQLGQPLAQPLLA